MEEQLIEALGMRLANRAYLYRILHIVFGAEPSRDELVTLGAQETFDAFQYLRDEEQASRTHIEIAVKEDVQTISVAKSLTDALALLNTLREKIDDANFIDVLKTDYTKLLMIPGSSYVHPWESPYIGKEAMLFQESTLDVRYRYREHGIEALEFGHFPEDHISMMFDFLAILSTRAFDAFSDGNDEEFRRILTSQGDFIAEHLTLWLPKFHNDLYKKDKRGIYNQFAEVLRAFLEVDKLFIAETLSAEWIAS